METAELRELAQEIKDVFQAGKCGADSEVSIRNGCRYAADCEAEVEGLEPNDLQRHLGQALSASSSPLSAALGRELLYTLPTPTSPR
jgi:hypothetical protein